MHHHVSLEIFSATQRCGPYQIPVNPFSDPKPPSGLFRPMTSPPVRKPAPRKAPWTLALLLDRLSGRPLFAPTPTTGASLLGPPHPSSDHCFPRAVIAPWLPPKTVDSVATTVVLARICGYTSKIAKPPCCRANTATRAPSSPEFRRHVSFLTRAPSSRDLRRHQSFLRPELHLQRSSPFTRASS